MTTSCTRCEQTGFLNLHQLPVEVSATFDNDGDEQKILKWIDDNNGHDVQVCDCCGDNETCWHGERGQHYSLDDPMGRNGPYYYNGGLCECH